jgi:hypothetical protein
MFVVAEGALLLEKLRARRWLNILNTMNQCN